MRSGKKRPKFDWPSLNFICSFRTLAWSGCWLRGQLVHLRAVPVLRHEMWNAQRKTCAILIHGQMSRWTARSGLVSTGCQVIYKWQSLMKLNKLQCAVDIWQVRGVHAVLRVEEDTNSAPLSVWIDALHLQPRAATNLKSQDRGNDVPTTLAHAHTIVTTVCRMRSKVWWTNFPGTLNGPFLIKAIGV